MEYTIEQVNVGGLFTRKIQIPFYFRSNQEETPKSLRTIRAQTIDDAIDELSAKFEGVKIGKTAVREG